MDAVGLVVCTPHSDATFLRLVGQILIVGSENRIASMCKQQLYRTGIPEKHLFLCFFARDRFPPHSVWLGAPSSPSMSIVVDGFS